MGERCRRFLPTPLCRVLIFGSASNLSHTPFSHTTLPHAISHTHTHLLTGFYITGNFVTHNVARTIFHTQVSLTHISLTRTCLTQLCHAQSFAQTSFTRLCMCAAGVAPLTLVARLVAVGPVWAAQAFCEADVLQA